MAVTESGTNWGRRLWLAGGPGGSLHVVCARPRIRQLTGLDRRLAPARTLEEALDAALAARSTPR